MSEYPKKKKFLSLPKYIGGSQAFRKFVGENLRYPAEALEARVEGKVIVAYDIDDNGYVHNPYIVKGLGYGCDEEAVRVVSLLRFEKVRNQGVRVMISTKTAIQFRLPAPTASIHYTINSSTSPKQPKTAEKTSKETYGYTITF